MNPAVKKILTGVGYFIWFGITIIYAIRWATEPQNIYWTVAGLLSIGAIGVGFLIRRLFKIRHPRIVSTLLTIFLIPSLFVIWHAPTFDPETGYRSTLGKDMASAVVGIFLLSVIGFIWYAWYKTLGGKE